MEKDENLWYSSGYEEYLKSGFTYAYVPPRFSTLKEQLFDILNNNPDLMDDVVSEIRKRKIEKIKK